jgi:glycosyltransferase involved in cell wall biosynthesis
MVRIRTWSLQKGYPLVSAVSRRTADVTVVIPVRNRPEVLLRALASVKAQTISPLEIIIVDDASTDNTCEVALAAGVTVLMNDRQLGSGPSRNKAIEAAGTRWIAFLDSDDEWFPDHLETVLAASEGQVLVTSVARDSDGGLRGNLAGEVVVCSPQRCLVPDNIVVTTATLIDRQAALDAGLFRALPRAQDLDLWVRILEIGGGVALARPTVTYHILSEWTTVESDSRDRDSVLRILDDYAERPWMTRSVREGVLGRMRWDYFRLALHERRWADAIRQAAWLGVHPAAWPALFRTLTLRRRGRRSHGKLSG